MVFVASGQPIEPVLEATLKFDTIPVTKFAPAHSEKLADAIVEGLRGKDEYIRKCNGAVMAPGMVCSSWARIWTPPLTDD